MSIGERARPIDWRLRSLGLVDYTADLSEPAHLHAAVLRSPHPYALIASIDTGRAERMPGVRAVITHADFPPGALYQHRGGPLSDRPPLAGDVVRNVGQEVAAVAADTREQAEAACRAIRVRYRPRRAPLTIAEARAPGARELHRRTTGLRNVSVRWAADWGDVPAGQAAAAHTVTGAFVYPSVSHAVMEPNTTLAAWDAERELLELWTSTQAPWFIVKEVAGLLGLSRDQVICREVAVGGGFGAKSKISEHEVLAAALARKSGRPVLLELSREEEFAANKPRHRFETRLRTSADADGRISLFEADIDVDNGAYNHMGSSVLRVGVITLGSMYRPDGVRFDARLVDTATQAGGQFRGYGTPQVSLAVESQVDELAERLGVDPIELRLRNLGAEWSTTLCGYEVTTNRLGPCLEAVRDGLDWDARRRERPAGHGLGAAVGMHGSGAYAYEFANRSDAAIDLFEDGSARVRFGGADAGTGQRTILAQVAAHELGVPLDRVEVLSMDGEHTPFELGAWSSRGTHMTGSSVGQAARELADRLRTLAADKLGEGRIELRDGRAVRGDSSVPLGDLVRLSPDSVDGVLSHETSYLLEGTEMLTPDRDTANLSPTYAFAAHGAEVHVDRRTGKVSVVDYVAAHDVGRAINPTMVEGQIAGGAAMGLGAALGEELVREGGRVVNAAYVNYALPRAADLPRIRPVIVEGDDPAGPYGAKSVGEMSIIPPGAAVVNAIYDAVGVRVRELPATPDKIIDELAKQEGRVRKFRIWRRPDRWWIALVRWAYPRGLHHVLHRWGVRFGPGVGPGPDAEPQPEELVVAAGAKEASAALTGDAVLVGGGTDVLTEARLRPARPARLVSVGDAPELRVLRRYADANAGADADAPELRVLRRYGDADGDGGFGLEIGAAVTLAELAEATERLAPAIAAAVASIASPQIRNAATVAGNLVQAKRCWFFRNGFPCYKRNGALSPCYAVLGDHRFQHAAAGAHRCQAVTPSDLATVLTAYDAEVEIVGPAGRTTVPLAEFYTGPGETVLGPADVVALIRVPAAALRRQGSFEKLALYSGDFATASAALTAAVDERGAWSDVRLVLGAVAPTPWRLTAVERAVEGTTPDLATLRRLVDAELDRHADPLPGNVWKLDAAAGLVEHAAEHLSTGKGAER
ncbi:molybdopterin cofactor-binding domain-containing protein [Nonomuraea glycinis]|uniref:molybdopterin cofactor-binding domain-containing protein n=1 Tax=Nonomuraea glycinis TaxID=2047744 RepID=UPI0033AEFB08